MIPGNFKLDHEYYIVELNDFRLPYEALEWLKENCGNRWTYRHPNIYFENHYDHLMFTVRWS